jgi:hypothetical protein
MPITGLALATIAGLAKSEIIDKPKAERQRKLAAETQRWSPWTGLKAGAIQEADPFGTALQFGSTGAMMGANTANSKALPTTTAAAPAAAPVTNYNYNSNPYDFWGVNQSGWIK